jgi:hypothetical protein
MISMFNEMKNAGALDLLEKQLDRSRNKKERPADSSSTAAFVV